MKLIFKRYFAIVKPFAGKKLEKKKSNKQQFIKEKP